MDSEELASPPWLVFIFLFSVLTKIALSNFSKQFRLFVLPDLLEPTNLSDNLADRLAYMTCKHVYVQVMSMTAMMFLVFQACKQDMHPSFKACKLYDAPTT